MILTEARRPEHGHARAVEVETLEAAQEFEKERYRTLEVGFPPTPPLQEQLLGALDFAKQRIAG